MTSIVHEIMIDDSIKTNNSTSMHKFSLICHCKF
jgi:hypothetical protein